MMRQSPIVHPHRSERAGETDIGPSDGIDICLGDASFLWPRDIRPSLFLEHAPFLFWLIDQVRPHCFVELGSARGFSYMAACQAIQDLRVDGRAFVVDPGLVHDENLDDAGPLNGANYSAFSSLLQMPFEAGVRFFDAGSIDLVNLGEAALDPENDLDLDCLIQKLSSQAVVLVQAINPGGRGAVVWNDLRKRGPRFEFVHGHGLGVVQMGTGPLSVPRALFDADRDLTRASNIRRCYARLGRAVAIQAALMETTAKTRPPDEPCESADGRAGVLDEGGMAQRIARERDLAVLAALETRLGVLESHRTDPLPPPLQGSADAPRSDSPATVTPLSPEVARGRPNRLKRPWWLVPLAPFQRRRRAFHGDKPSPLFDAAWYRATYAGVVDPHVDPFADFQAKGLGAGRRPNAFFDPAWYVRQYPDVARSPMSPLDHYLLHGAREGRDPSPDFSTLGYLERNRDVARSGRNPLLHFLQHGKKEGRAPKPEAYAGANGSERSQPIPARNRLDAMFCDEPPVDKAIRAMLPRLARIGQTLGPVDAVILLPLFGKGGSEKTALAFARLLRESRRDRSVLLLVTDRSLIDRDCSRPEGCMVLGLDEFVPRADDSMREEVLFRLIQLLAPRILHVINSDAGWRMLRNRGTAVEALTRVFGSMFCIQREPGTDKPIGYAATYADTAARHTKVLMSDNRAFFDDLAALDPSSADRIAHKTIYNPCDWVAQHPLPTRPATRMRTTARPHILWASRLDRQKRADLVGDIARHMPDCDFSVFGEAVTDGDTSLVQGPNMTLHGPFSTPEQLFARGPYDAFIYTSHEDGLPNILLEVGLQSLPIVAPALGGIVELITKDTGTPVPSKSQAHDYVKALRAILRDPTAAAARAARLRAIITTRHSWESFARSVADVPHYL